MIEKMKVYRENGVVVNIGELIGEEGEIMPTPAGWVESIEDVETREDGSRVAMSDYVTRRRETYPAIGEQLDALWHAMDSGELPKVTGFYDTIKEVKDKNPKK